MDDHFWAILIEGFLVLVSLGVSAFFSGATHAELSESLALPLGTVKSWIRRGLAELKRCLER